MNATKILARARSWAAQRPRRHQGRPLPLYESLLPVARALHHDEHWSFEDIVRYLRHDPDTAPLVATTSDTALASALARRLSTRRQPKTA